MARFVPKPLVPVGHPPNPTVGTGDIRIQPKPNAVPAPAPGSTGDALTLDALMMRQKELAANQQANMQQPAANIPQGLGQLAWTLVNGLQERQARKDEAAGNADVAAAFGKMDQATGDLPSDALGTIMQRNPDLGAQIYAAIMQRKASQAKVDQWTQIPTPEGETGQWYQNQTGETKKVGGSTEPGTWKPTDIGALRDDYTKAATTYQTAAPSWQSMKEAAAAAIGKTGPEVGSADLNLVVGLAKILDPNSVVREGESESVKKTGGAADYLVSYYNQLVQGGSLSDDIRKGIMATGQSRMKAYFDQAKGQRDWISGIATRHGVDPNDVVPPLPDFEPYAGEDPNKPDPNKPPPADPNLHLTPAQEAGDEPYQKPDGTWDFSRMSNEQFAAYRKAHPS